MVKLVFDGNRINYELIPYVQNSDNPGVFLKKGADFQDWKKRCDKISVIITDKDKLEEKYQELLNRTERFYSTNLTPYNNRITLALYMRHLLPMLMSKRKLRTLLNMLMCESHYDRMLRMLMNYIM